MIKMNMKILAIGIVALFIGMATFSGATNIESKTDEPQEDETTDKYLFATTELIEGELEITGDLGWFAIPFPPFRSKEISRGFLISSQTTMMVYSGELKVKPTTGDEITLYPGDTIEMRISFEFLTENLTTHRLTEFKGKAIGVTIILNTD